MYKVTSEQGIKKFKREQGAHQYAKELMKQGIKSEVAKLQPYISPARNAELRGES
jgi:hypothetical protein